MSALKNYEIKEAFKMLILDLHNDQQLTEGNKDKAKKDAEEFKKM